MTLNIEREQVLYKYQYLRERGIIKDENFPNVIKFIDDESLDLTKYNNICLLAKRNALLDTKIMKVDEILNTIEHKTEQYHNIFINILNNIIDRYCGENITLERIVSVFNYEVREEVCDYLDLNISEIKSIYFYITRRLYDVEDVNVWQITVQQFLFLNAYVTFPQYYYIIRKLNEKTEKIKKESEKE